MTVKAPVLGSPELAQQNLALIPEEDRIASGTEWKIPCPADPAGGRHLSLNMETNTFNCFAGHDWNTVAWGLLRRGLLPNYYFIRYEYVDESGRKLLVHGKSRPKEPGRQPDWTHGYEYRSNGVPIERKGKGSCDGVRRVLYDLPLLRASTKIWIAAGEKDAELLRYKFGKNATTRPFGEAAWDDGYLAQLDHATHITIVIDNDDAGYRGGWTIYRNLRNSAAKLKVVRPHDDTKDFFDHVNFGYGLADLQPVNLSVLEERGAKSRDVSRKQIEVDAIASAQPEFSQLISELEARLSSDPSKLNPRDIAKELVAQANGLAYLPKTKQHLRWNGNHYEGCEVELHTQIVPAAVEVSRSVLTRLAEEAGKNEKLKGLAGEYRKREYAFSRGAFPTELVSLIDKQCMVDDELFDADFSILSCESGVLDREAAKAGEIAWLPHDPSRLITQCIPFAYDPKAIAPEWTGLLEDSIADPEQRSRLQTLIGFALAGDDTKKKRIVNLVGPTDSGKSTVLYILSRIIGCYLGDMRIEEIIVSRYNAKFDFHGLMGSRAVFLTEPDQDSRFRSDGLKRITGGEPITTEGKGTKPVTWQASVMPFIGTNYHIQFDIRDEAFERRLEFIEFARRRDIDYDLKKKLLAELPGIFNWLLGGVIAYFSGGLADTQASEAARRRAEVAVAEPLQFVLDALELGRVSVAPPETPFYKCARVGELYKLYQEWYSVHGKRKVGAEGRKRFSEIMSKYYPTTDKPAEAGGYIVFRGLVLGPNSGSPASRSL